MKATKEKKMPKGKLTEKPKETAPEKMSDKSKNTSSKSKMGASR